MSSSPLGSLLQIYAAYRLGVTLILWLLFLLHTGIGDENPTLFYVSAACYLAVNLFLLLKALHQWQPSYAELFFTVLSDVLLLQLIARSSGPYDSGTSILMLVAIAAGSMFMSRHYLLLPAIATIAVLSFTVFDLIQNNANTANMVASGWLSIAFFVTSIAINYLTQQLKRSEQLAASEAALAKQLEQLNSVIIERMQTGIAVINHNGKILTCNSAAKQLLGYRASIHGEFSSGILLATINQKMADFIFLWQGDSNQSLSNATIETEDSATILQLTPVSLADENDPKTLIFIEDMAKIAQQAQHLKLSSLGKLTASIAHEIRNPVGAISHAAQLLALDVQTEQEKKLANIISEQSKRCSNIIESVMSVSRGKPGSIDQFNLVTWLESFLASYRVDKIFDCSIQAPAELTVRFDKSQLEQIVSNLLNNAIHAGSTHSDQPRVKLAIYTDHNQKPVLEIIDQGNGVNNEDVERLFEPFFTTGKTGSGLGLYICRELCRANQATITYSPTGNADSDFSPHCFRVQFSHPDRQPLHSQNNATQAF